MKSAGKGDLKSLILNELQERQEKFLSIVRAEGIPVTLRREKGHDIDAACGQLRLQKTLRAETSSRLVFHHGRLRG